MGRVSELIRQLAIEVKALLKQAMEIAWFSRGGVQYQDALKLTPIEREVFFEFINSRLEAQKKSMNPIY